MAAKVILYKDDKPVQQFMLMAENTTIGRKSENHIAIKDPAISGTHAKIQVVNSNYIIQDLGSTNGLHIRGRRIRQQVLKHGDVITVGEHKLQFVDQEKVKTAASGEPAAKAKAAPAAAAPSDSAPAGTAEKPPATAPKAEPPPIFNPEDAYLAVMSGAEKDTRIALIDALTTIGEPGVQVAAVSTRPLGHFIIHVDGGKDKRVPLVNGEPTGFKSRKLEHGDRIVVADIEMEYRYS